jgi:ABC-2 type transport system ATP-binding protein
MYGIDEGIVRSRVKELLGAMELNGNGKKPLAEFSAGMRKRVAFAAAIINSPEIIFLDEPFVSIDPAGVAVMKQWLQRPIAQGRTVFMTSHVLENVERVCNRAAIIQKPGRLFWEGDITPFANNQPVEFDSRSCHALEELYLRVSGERRHALLSWL